MRVLDDFGEHPGYLGVFTRNQAPGAYLNGSTVHKGTTEPGDATPEGTPGTVLGSIYDPELGYFYFVEWSNRPGMAIGVTSLKLKAAGRDEPGTVN